MVYKCNKISNADFVGIILKGDKHADEAMYYLLRQRLKHQLIKRFEVVHNKLSDSYDDVIDDFFLYLRDGKDGTNKITYQSLMRIKNRETFSTWLINTFRNYLKLQVTKEKQINNEIDDSPSILTDEQKLSFASNLIAYAHQVLSPRDCFILFRTLLTMLNKKQALPNEAMAKALGMSDIAYRVTVHRIKCNLAKYRTQLLQGQPLHLDEQHQAMAQKINDDFMNLYPTLLIYYNQVVELLHCADAVKELRQEYYEETGYMLHEAEAEYSVAITITYFWNRLEGFFNTYTNTPR